MPGRGARPGRATEARAPIRCGLTKTEFQEHSNTTGYEASFPDFAWTSVESVATAGLDGVAKNRAIVVPGMFYKGLVTTSAFTPRGVTRRLSGIASSMRR